MNEVKQIVHTKTQEQFDRVLDILENKGIDTKWTIRRCWDIYGADTYLYIRNGLVTYGEKSKGSEKAISYNQFLLDEGIIRYVYVSDESIEDALRKKDKRILLHDFGEQFKIRYICVEGVDNEKYLKGEKDIRYAFWGYKAEIPSNEAEPKIEMSIGEIADKLGIDKSRLLIKE